GAPRDARVAGTPLRGPSVTDCGPWIPAYAGMSGSEALRRALFRRALAQDVPELGLERGERFHQRGGIELPWDAGRQLVCGVIGKMSPVCLAVQHRAAPSQLAMQDRSAAVKVGLSMSRGARLGVACCDCATHSVFPRPATRGEGRPLRLKLDEIGGAVTRDARGEIDLPRQVVAHGRAAVTRPLV